MIARDDALAGSPEDLDLFTGASADDRFPGEVWPWLRLPERDLQAFVVCGPSDLPGLGLGGITVLLGGVLESRVAVEVEDHQPTGGGRFQGDPDALELGVLPELVDEFKRFPTFVLPVRDQRRFA